jgi:hypothetical protein
MARQKIRSRAALIVFFYLKTIAVKAYLGMFLVLINRIYFFIRTTNKPIISIELDRSF